MNSALRIQDYYKVEIEELKGNVFINQFIVNALTEKIAKRGSIENMLDILSRVLDVEPYELAKL
jgi:hypothetical protein